MKGINVFAFAIGLVISYDGFCQTDTKPDLKPYHVIGFQMGGFAWQGYVERELKPLNLGRLYVRVGGGKVSAPDYYGSWAHVSAGLLTGKKDHHLDIVMGPGIFNISDEGPLITEWSCTQI